MEGTVLVLPRGAQTHASKIPQYTFNYIQELHFFWMSNCNRATIINEPNHLKG